MQCHSKANEIDNFRIATKERADTFTKYLTQFENEQIRKLVNDIDNFCIATKKRADNFTKDLTQFDNKQM